MCPSIRQVFANDFTNIKQLLNDCFADVFTYMNVRKCLNCCINISYCHVFVYVLYVNKTQIRVYYYVCILAIISIMYILKGFDTFIDI